MPTSLQGRAQKANRPKGSRFRNLYGLRNEDFLQPCWRASRKDAASGVEHVSAQVYAPPLDETIHGLVERLQQKRYRANRVRRQSRPTGDGTPRPWGIPAGEAKLRPLGVARLLEAIDEQDLLRGRDGYRPAVGALDAVDTLTITLPCGR